MESKVTVLTPNGRRHIVKVTPNTPMLHILETACTKYGFSSDEYCLRHHKKEVSLSQVFRFSGLPNNCLLEMSQTDKKRIAMPVEICVQFEDGSRKQSQFMPADNLWDVVKQLTGEAIEQFQSPVILYMRQEIVGREQLLKTTLKSLGILEGRALLRLVDKQLEELKTQAMFYVPSVTKSVSKEDNNEKPGTSKGIVAGGSGFAITKDLVQSLKKTSTTETKDTEETDREDAVSTHQKEATPETEKLKYDWGTAPGRSMCKSEIKMDVDENVNIEPEIEPEYHILGERNALIYSIDAAKSKIEELPDSFYELTVNDLKLVLSGLKKTAAGNADAPLLTEKHREIEDNNTMLRKISQYKNCVIRIQFPDRFVLQGMFKPIDTISNVIEFIKMYLENPDKQFYLFTVPPKTKLAVDKTLLELDFVPNAIVHFSLESESDNEKFIKSEFLNKLTPPEGALYAAKKIRKHHNYSPDDDTKQDHSITPSPSTGAIPKRPKK